MKNIILLFAFFSFAFSFKADNFIKVKMPRLVSSNSEKEIAPYINMNGDKILYSIKDSHSATWSVEIAHKRKGEWSRGIDVPSINSSKKLNLIGGYAISPNGKKIIFTSKKHGGIGSYDLWSTHLKNDTWSTPENLGKPINSTLNDAAPSYSRDGKTIYFMRCKELSNTSASNCQIMTSKELSDRWSKPQAIEIESNTSSKFILPKVGSDSKTLYLYGNPGFYVSKKENETWGKPNPINYLPSSTEDRFVSLMKHSNKIYFSEEGEHSQDLFVGKLEETDRAVQLTELRMIAKSHENSEKSTLLIYDANKDKLISRTVSKENGRVSTLMEPGKYLYFLSSENEKNFTIDTLNIINPEKFTSILKTPDLTPHDSIYLHTNASNHSLFDKLFYKGLTHSIKSRGISDSVKVFTPETNFFSNDFYNKVNNSNYKISFIIDSSLAEMKEILIVY